MKYFFKKIIPILIIVLVSGLLFFGYTYATRNLRIVLSRFLEEDLDAEFSIGHVGLGFPFCLELKDVKIDDSIDISSMQIYPSPTSFLLKRGFILSTVKIINPIVKIKKEDKKKFSIPGFMKKREKIISSEVKDPGFYPSKLIIQNGTLIYDKGKGDKLEFVKIKASIWRKGTYFSRQNNFLFIVTSFLKNKDSDFLPHLKISGRIKSSNLMEARLQAGDIKLDTLGVIYKKYLSNIVEACRVDFDSDIQISENNLIADCLLKGENIALKNALDKRIDTPFVASFILIFNFKNRLVKVKNLQSNFLSLILDKS